MVILFLPFSTVSGHLLFVSLLFPAFDEEIIVPLCSSNVSGSKTWRGSWSLTHGDNGVPNHTRSRLFVDTVGEAVHYDIHQSWYVLGDPRSSCADPTLLQHLLNECRGGLLGLQGISDLRNGLLR